MEFKKFGLIFRYYDLVRTQSAPLAIGVATKGYPFKYIPSWSGSIHWQNETGTLWTKEGILLMLASIGFFILWSTAIERFVTVLGLGVGEVNSTKETFRAIIFWGWSILLTLLPIRQTDACSANPSFFFRVPIPEMWQMRLWCQSNSDVALLIAERGPR